MDFFIPGAGNKIIPTFYLFVIRIYGFMILLYIKQGIYYHYKSIKTDHISPSGKWAVIEIGSFFTG